MTSRRAKGVLVTLAGVVLVSPDAMLLRWMRSLGASSPDVACAKYLGIIAFMVTLASCRGLGGTLVSPRHLGAAAGCQLFNQLAFTFCLLLTDTATALLLISLSPLWAALLGVLTMQEPLPRRTMVALVLSVVAIGCVFVPNLLDGAPSRRGSFAGDLLALLAGFAQGASLTVNRHAALHQPQADLTLGTAVSSLGAAIVALSLPCYDSDEDPHDFWACTPPVWRTPAFLILAVCDALAVASLYTAMLVAPKFITGSEVALIMLLEVVLGPLFVFMRFGEAPGLWTVAGGTLLLGTLAWHEVAARGAADKPPADLAQVKPEEDRAYHRLAAQPA